MILFSSKSIILPLKGALQKNRISVMINLDYVYKKT